MRTGECSRGGRVQLMRGVHTRLLQPQSAAATAVWPSSALRVNAHHACWLLELVFGVEGMPPALTKECQQCSTPSLPAAVEEEFEGIMVDGVEVRRLQHCEVLSRLGRCCHAARLWYAASCYTAAAAPADGRPACACLWRFCSPSTLLPCLLPWPPAGARPAKCI